MSPTLDEVQIAAVLLLDGWHKVANRSFLSQPFTVKDAQDQTAFSLEEPAWWVAPDASMVVCPRSSVLAYKTAPRPKSPARGKNRRD